MIQEWTVEKKKMKYFLNSKFHHMTNMMLYSNGGGWGVELELWGSAGQDESRRNDNAGASL